MNKNQSSNQNGQGTLTDQKKNEAGQKSNQNSSKKTTPVDVEDEFETPEKTRNEKEHQDKEHQHDFKSPVGSSNSAKGNSGNVKQGDQSLNKGANPSSNQKSQTK